MIHVLHYRFITPMHPHKCRNELEDRIRKPGLEIKEPGIFCKASSLFFQGSACLPGNVATCPAV
jgi:hypothetical protein